MGKLREPAGASVLVCQFSYLGLKIDQLAFILGQLGVAFNNNVYGVIQSFFELRDAIFGVVEVFYRGI